MTGRIRIVIRGAVQGVGFRPFVFRAASERGLSGWVRNFPGGVSIEAEGPQDDLEEFLIHIGREFPPRAFIQSLEHAVIDPAGGSGFEIRASEAGGETTALVLPDIATCPDCLREVLDPGDRRHRYPFANCTNCGPRYSIIESLPYDRPNTSMRLFGMCGACRAEYENPLDRRFHAQPIACPECGPSLQLWTPDGKPIASGDDALCAAADEIRGGRVVAVKGIGGFHLMVDARSESAIDGLRARKHREEKPFALMFGAAAMVRAECEVAPLEQRALESPECPIVLVRRRAGAGQIAPQAAPGNPYLGVMLPPTPLHHLLLGELGFPVVATSGNLSDEPICTDEFQALSRLRGIADVFLVHNRPIVRHVDDSILRIVAGRELVLRRARGFAPLPIDLRAPGGGWLAVGAHLKNAVALGVGSDAFVSQHIGDLENEEALGAFERVIESLTGLYGAGPSRVAADMHPDYLSTRYARSSGRPVTQVQHHCAHVASCMAENGLTGPLLGVAWDGTGYGPDGTVWGGEFLVPCGGVFERFACLRTFRLPGGETAVREPRRSALGVLFELEGDRFSERRDLPPIRAFTASELSTLGTMLARSINSPRTSSAGRLFDAVSAIAGLRQVARFEGQAAMELEFAADGEGDAIPYPVRIVRGASDSRSTQTSPAWVLDWGPLIAAVLDDATRGLPAGGISARFHAALAAAIVEVARRAGLEKVVLTGGCFQNRVLLERTVRGLEGAGFRPYWHQRVPPNDGGIALGQLFAAAHMMGQNSEPADRRRTGGGDVPGRTG